MIDILVPLTPSPGGVNRVPLFLLHLLLLFRALWNDAGMTSDRQCVGMCVGVVYDSWPCGPMLYRPWVVREGSDWAVWRLSVFWWPGGPLLYRPWVVRVWSWCVVWKGREMVGSRVRIGVECKVNGPKITSVLCECCCCRWLFPVFWSVGPMLYRPWVVWYGSDDAPVSVAGWSTVVPPLSGPCVRAVFGRSRIGREEAGKLSEWVGNWLNDLRNGLKWSGKGLKWSGKGLKWSGKGLKWSGNGLRWSGNGLKCSGNSQKTAWNGQGSIWNDWETVWSGQETVLNGQEMVRKWPEMITKQSETVRKRSWNGHETTWNSR